MVMGPAGSSSLDDVHILASNNFIDNNVCLIIGKPERNIMSPISTTNELQIQSKFSSTFGTKTA